MSIPNLNFNNIKKGACSKPSTVKLEFNPGQEEGHTFRFDNMP